MPTSAARKVDGLFLIGAPVFVWMVHFAPHRVEAERCRSAPLSEPYVKVSLHTAQASQRVPLWGAPVAKPCLATFAILISSLLASRRTGAPAEAVICFPVYEGSRDAFAMKHQSDVSLSSPLQRGLRFFRPLPAVPPTAALRLTCPARAGRSDDLPTFLVIVYRGLRRSLYTGGCTASIPCRDVRDRQPSTAPASTGKQAFDLSAP